MTCEYFIFEFYEILVINVAYIVDMYTFFKNNSTIYVVNSIWVVHITNLTHPKFWVLKKKLLNARNFIKFD